MLHIDRTTTLTIIGVIGLIEIFAGIAMLEVVPQWVLYFVITQGSIVTGLASGALMFPRESEAYANTYLKIEGDYQPIRRDSD